MFGFCSLTCARKLEKSLTHLVLCAMAVEGLLVTLVMEEVLYLTLKMSWPLCYWSFNDVLRLASVKGSFSNKVLFGIRE